MGYYVATFADRLNQALDSKGYPKRGRAQKLIEVLNIDRTSRAVKKWLDGDTLPQLDQRIIMADRLGLSLGWLETGEGDMNTPSIQSNVSGEFMQVSAWDSSTPVECDEVSVPFYKDFGVACGYGSDGEAKANEWRRLRISKWTIQCIGSHPDKVFATTADGDSMSPTINDGSTIWVDTSKQTIKDGKIFMFEYGGMYMCKYLYRQPNDGVRVVSENSDHYPEWIITAEDRELNNFRIIGWVFHWSVMDRW